MNFIFLLSEHRFVGALFKLKYNKYGKLTEIKNVLSNTYDIAPTCKNGSYSVLGVDSSSSLLARSTDLVTGQIKQYAYESDRLSAVKTSDGSDESFVYDGMGRLSEKTFTCNSVSFKDNMDYLSDALSPTVKYHTYSINGVQKASTSNTYDGYNRLSTKCMRVLHLPFTKFIEYDKTRISRVIDDNSVVNIHDISYTYDSMGRMLSENDSEVSNNEKAYVYDKYGRLVRENNKYLDKTYVYEYNEIGNITSVKEYSYTTGTVSGGYSSKALVYGDASNPDRLTKYGYKDISYDSNGYPTRYGDMILVWDRGKLVKMYEDVDDNSYNSKETYEFKYNAYGQRISKIYDYDPGPDYSGNFLIGYEITYTYDNSGRLIREDREEYYTESASVTYETVYLYDQSDILGFTLKRGNVDFGTYYFNKNIHGDVTEIYNSTDSAVVKYAYDAYGNCTVLHCSDSLADRFNPIRYRSYYYDIDTKLYYLNARYYNPEWHRFISPDSTEYLDPETPNGLNLYIYCNNDPVNYADPSGHLAISTLILCGLALSGIGLAIGGVALDNNTMTAIGLTIIAIPSMISGIGALLSGATYLSIIGGVTASAGLITGVFATAEYQEAFTGNNWIIDKVGMNEELYNVLMLTIAAIATAGTIATEILASIGNATVPNQMMNSLQKHPNRWKTVKNIVEPAKGGHKGGISTYSNYINKWTGSKLGIHKIVRAGRFIHGPHFHPWI